ncbi:hypothetical protein FKM82_023124, partial [Ascaphus truei]
IIYLRVLTFLFNLFFQLSLLIGFLCVKFARWTDYSTYCYFEVVTICFLILIFIFYVVNMFRIYRMLTCISWPLTELLHYGIGTFLLLIASIVAAVKSFGCSGLVAGAVRIYLLAHDLHCLCSLKKCKSLTFEA